MNNELGFEKHQLLNIRIWCIGEVLSIAYKITFLKLSMVILNFKYANSNSVDCFKGILNNCISQLISTVEIVTHIYNLK